MIQPAPEASPTPEASPIAVVSSGAGSSAALPSVQAAPSTTTGTVTVSPEQGGSTTITNVDGSRAKLTFVPNTVSIPTIVRITPVTKSTVIFTSPPPASFDIVGNWVYSFNTVVAGRVIQTFPTAVTLTFIYTDAQVKGFDEESLKTYYLDKEKNKWLLLPNSQVNTKTNTLTASTFSFGLFTIMGRTVAQVFRPGDINEDGKVDLIDFSILLYNYGIPINKKADLNNDGVVDLVDFSIMLYWWTG
ncbi:MAG: hypothetical protein Q8N56_01625 [bacterium]|nr:hypothetical protein [bacterium]